ncbi:MAG: nitroreductase family protein [Atopobiaceae bacterium]|nr:nitroreductase family protein [Atopobiaceae bacterium]
MPCNINEETIRSIGGTRPASGFGKLVVATRSMRRYAQEPRVSEADLLGFVDIARRTACASNNQQLRFHVVSTPEECMIAHDEIGSWAGSIKEWPGPEPDECPTGYIIILAPKSNSRSRYVDAGIAAQTMGLAAREAGFAYCMFMSAKRTMVEALGLPEEYEVLLVLSFGADGETVVLEDSPDEHRTGYWRDERSIHHVPKLSLGDVLI